MNRLVAPAYFRNVNKSFHSGSDFKECTVVFDIYNLAFNYTAFCNGISYNIPWMGLKLLETKRYSLFVFIKVKHNDMDFLIDLQNFRRMIDSSPTDICNI